MGKTSFMSASHLLFGALKQTSNVDFVRLPPHMHRLRSCPRLLLQVLLLVALALTAWRGVSLESQSNSIDPASNAKKPSKFSEREQNGLHGPVKAYVEETTYPPQTLADGKQFPEVKRWEKTEYEEEGHVVVRRFRNPDGSEWVRGSTYSPAGLLLKMTSGKDPEPGSETIYPYDSQGRLESIANSKKPDNPITFHYDENGRKTKLSIARPEDYVSRTGLGTTVFVNRGFFRCRRHRAQSARRKQCNHDFVEIQVRDLRGELVSKTVRIYDDRGNVIEEKQTMDDVMKMIPAETQNKMLAGSNASLNDLRDQLTKFLGDQGDIWSVAYSYDAQGRVSQTTRRVFNHTEYTVQSTYNDHGDVALEITHTTLTASGDGRAPETHYSEAHYSYEYDDHGNWTEKKVSSRSSPDSAFTSSNETTRTLEYF